MIHDDIRALGTVELDQVTGADNGVVAGPNGEGCTEPTVPAKPGQERFTLDQMVFG